MSRWYTLAAVAVLAAAAPATLRAQEGTVAGTVTATGSDEPLSGALVTVVGGTQRASADAQGRFRIAGVTGPNVTLEARRIGYRAGRTTVRNGETHARIVLVSSPQSLEAVVVSASGGRAEKKAIGNSVATVDAAAATEIAPINSMQGLLNGRAPGVVVQPATGAVGSGGRIRVRGNASFSLSNEPLLYVDGVRVNNNPSSGPQNQDFGSSSISRINDLNPDDIESIEILKGPAAAALYGTEASNGVIQVITKRGSGGVPKWNFITRQGINYFQDWANRFWTNYGTIPRAGTPGALDTLPITMAQIRDTLGFYGFNRDVFRNGRKQQTELSVNGGSDVFSYFASGNYLDDAGAEPNNYQRKASGRVNLGVTPSQSFRISINAGAVAGPTYLSCEAGCGGRVWTLTATTPSNCANKWTHCLYSSIPEAYDETYNFWQDMNRLSSSVRFDHTPATWFTHRLTAGVDRTGEQNVYYTPRIDSLLASTQIGDDALGSKDVENRDVTYASLDYAATASKTFRSDYSTATTVGAQYYRDNTHFARASGCVFPLPGLLDISATNGPCTGSVPTEDGFGNATLGVYGQEQIGWRDMLFLTAAIRSDNSSAFGTNYSRAVYPKFSVSWVASQSSFVRDHLPSLSELRFRAAYGEAGKAPATYSATRTFTPTPGYNNAPSITAGAAGNPNLRPERGKEVEVGFDASGYNDRVGMEFTYYRKRTTDAILDRELAPSLGYTGAPIPAGAVSSGTQPFNAGEIRNSGTELLLRATPYQSDNVNWDATFTLATNDNKVVDLGTPGLNFVTAGTYGRHQVGFPVGAWFEQRVVSAVYNPTTGKAVATCDNGSGGSMPCYGADGVAGTSDDAPDLYLGRSTPPTEGSFSSTITLFKNFRLYGLIDFQNGWSKMNGNERVRCTVAVRCFENYYPAQSDPVIVAEYQSNRQLVDRLIQDASFTKLRELTIAYDVPERFAQRLRASRASIAISGHNLHTWTKYKGLEPEATFLGGTRGGFFSWEQTTLPQLTQWTASLSLTL
jgi:TonB-linked SusC/RagA family outer membrane protein